jgi:hypothetical protein
MRTKQQNASPGPGETPTSPAAEAEEGQPRKTTTSRQDFVFAVKLFVIAGLVVLAFWWLNRIV